MSPTISDEDLDEICSVGSKVAREIVVEILAQVSGDPEGSFEEEIKGKQKKACLGIDSYAEKRCFTSLRRKYDEWHFLGEESLRNEHLDLSAHKGTFVLTDAVDGTDLLERGFHNWCCDFAIFDPRETPGQRLVASFVALPGGDVYYARRDKDGAFVRRAKDQKIRTVSGGSKVKKVAEASICFYGQQIENLKSVTDGQFIKNISAKVHKNGKRRKLRIYNLGGVPMMVKMIDKTITAAAGVDAVIELKGQKSHDVVPGAFIAKKAGASVLDLDGKEISYVALENALMKPGSTRLTYVMAVTPQLARELVACIGR